MDDWRGFAEQMASLARDLLAQESLNDTLGRITASATELVEDCDAAGILILRGNHVQSLAPTEQVVIDSDELQGRVGEGPC
ncbi:antitermination regulator, partial [Streptomyces sp. SID6013]|nr:antitermination regulator [Streptomyces sp. SID6013]